jgi:hypothetical protein
MYYNRPDPLGKVLMKYRVIRGTVIDGRDVRPGDIVEISGMLSKQLMQTGKVMPHDEIAPLAPAVEYETREPRRRGRVAKD